MDAEDRAEGFLVLVEAGGGQLDGDIEAADGEQQRAETDVDGVAGGAEAVDLAEHVAEDVGQREQEEGAVGR